MLCTSKALQNVFLRDKCTVSDKYLDAFCQDANRQIGGGMNYVLTSQAHKMPSLSKVYDVAGGVCTFGAKDLETSHDRSKVDRGIFSIAAMKHHIYRQYVGNLNTRQPGANVE
eukprot:2617869-Ditylum_brightwellii.AAC.1